MDSSSLELEMELEQILRWPVWTLVSTSHRQITCTGTVALNVNFNVVPSLEWFQIFYQLSSFYIADNPPCFASYLLADLATHMAGFPGLLRPPLSRLERTLELLKRVCELVDGYI